MVPPHTLEVVMVMRMVTVTATLTANMVISISWPGRSLLTRMSGSVEATAPAQEPWDPLGCHWIWEESTRSSM